MQSSLAAQIPEELFEDVLWHVCDFDRMFNRAEKKTLSKLALVCRYWARMCREDLFRDITLRTLDDVHHFRELCDRPALSGLSPISQFIYIIHAKPDRNDKPWLHHLFLFLIPMLRTLRMNRGFISLHVKVLPLGGHTQSWRTLDPSLPRSLPGSLMLVHDLHLDGTYFVDGRALLRLLSSIPALERVLATGVTFGTKPWTEEVIPALRARREGKLQAVVADDLDLCFSLIPFMTRRKGPESVIDEEHLKLLWELFRVFDAAPKFDISCSSSTSIEYLCRSHQSGEGHVAPVLEVLLGLSEPVRKVQGIEIDLRYTISEDGEDLRSETAWNHLTELLLKFPHSTDICLHLRQDERFPPFMRENYAAYKRLVEERRLWYKLGSARGRQRVVLNPGYVAKDSGDCEDKGEGGSDSHT